MLKRSLLSVHIRTITHGLTVEYGAEGDPVRFAGGADPRTDGAAIGYRVALRGTPVTEHAREVLRATSAPTAPLYASTLEGPSLGIREPSGTWPLHDDS
jgi:hypothetical protein